MGAAIVRYLLIFTAGLGSCIAILILIGLFHHNGGPAIDSLMSPDGTTIVEKINCDEPFDYDYRISIRGTPGVCQEANDDVIRIRNPYSVDYLWLDNVHLLVAAPNLYDIEGRPGKINNIAITYSAYSITDPAEVRDSNVVSASTVSIVPNYEFRSMDLKVYVGCNLFVSANLPRDHAEVRLRVYVQKSVKPAWANGRIGDIPESPNAYLQFTSAGDFEFPKDWVTAATMRDVAIERGGRDAGRFTEIWTRERFATSLPNGSRSPPKQHIIFSISESSLQTVLDKLRSGDFEIDFGYWFSNKKAAYVSSKMVDTQSSDEFVGCLRANEVYASVH
jgi:hypothetical protein